MPRRALERLSFDNTYVRLPEAFYAKLNPTPFQAPPYLIDANAEAAAWFGRSTASRIRG
jgi:hypothetical protein